MRLPYFLAKRFVAGETFEQAEPKVRELNQKGISATLDLLGEHVDDRTTTRSMVDSYIDLIKKIGSAGLDSTISVKLSMMGLDIDTGFCKEQLYRLLRSAEEYGCFIRIDMESSEYIGRTIDIFRAAHREFGNRVGIVIQAYLYRSARDIPELAGLGADIRLCKGAYSEPADTALQEMSKIRSAFKEYVAVLLEKAPFPRIATHDEELIEWTKDYAEKKGVGKKQFEFQMLYGMRQPTMEQLAVEGYRTRIYVPFGTMWYPYFKRRLLERKENIWFVLQNLFKS